MYICRRGTTLGRPQTALHHVPSYERDITNWERQNPYARNGQLAGEIVAD